MQLAVDRALYHFTCFCRNLSNLEDPLDVDRISQCVQNLSMCPESLNVSNIVQLKEGGNWCVEFLKQSATFFSSGASSRSVLTSLQL